MKRMVERTTFLPGSEGQGAIVKHRGALGMWVGQEFLPLPIGGGQYGTLSTLDTLAATQQSIAAYNEDRAWEQVSVALAAHNGQMQELLADFVEISPDRQRRYGSAASKTMQELDQFGQPQAQKITAGVTVGFPLRKYGDALQWTRDFMLTTGSAAQLAAEVNAMMDADRRNVILQIKSALMNPTNYTFTDVLVDSVSLAVKRLVNADSAAIPLGPNGESFNAATHTHYLFTAAATLAAADLSGLISTVTEHHPNGEPVVFINQAQEAAVRGLTGFVAYIDARIVRGGGSTTDVGNRALDMTNVNNRAIGLFGAAEIWVKPWMPSGYLLAMVRDTGMSTLVMRTRDPFGELRLVYEDESHPLRAQSYQREFGIGVWQRTSAAVLFVDAGSGGAYVAPTLTA